MKYLIRELEQAKTEPMRDSNSEELERVKNLCFEIGRMASEELFKRSPEFAKSCIES